MMNIIKKTPLEFNYRLSKLYNCNVYLKREDLQIVRSFKIRGAYNKISKIKNNNKIVCASAGNHAQGVAYICNKLNKDCDIFIPNNTPYQKINKIKYFGNDNCNIIKFGNNFDSCLTKALGSINNNKTFVHPFNDYDVIEGQGEIINEIYNDIKPDIVSVCVGGGGLISGLCLNNKKNNYNIQIYGAEAETCASMKLSLKNNYNTKLYNLDNFVDGASVAKIGDINFNIVKNNVTEINEIVNGHICEELINFYNYEGIILEPAGALSVCNLKYIPDLYGKTVVCILSGGNNDLTRYSEIVEKYLIYKELRHYFIVEFNQNPGELRTFIKNIVGKNDDIIRFEYIKKSNKQVDSALIGIEVKIPSNIKIFTNNLNKYNLNYEEINNNKLLYSLLV